MSPGPPSPSQVQVEPSQAKPSQAEVRQTERRTDLRTAVVTYLACVLLLAVDLTGITTDAPFAPDNRWWHLLPLTAGCALMLIKRHRPILAVIGGAALIVVDLLLGGSLGSLIVFVDLLYAAGLYSSPRARRVLTVTAGFVVVALMIAAGVTSSGDLQAIVAGALQGAALVGMPLWWAADVRRKSDLAALAMEREALASAHAADLTRIADLRRRDAVQAERRAMARDLHDVVAGHVSAVAIRTGAALTQPDVAPRERETLEFVRATSLTTLAEMRTMILLLRGDPASGSTPDRDAPSGADDEPVASPGRLHNLLELVDVHRSGGRDVALSKHPVDLALPVAVDQAAYRIVQEALTNAAKHGGTGPIAVDVGATASTLTLAVTNPLPAAAPPAGHAVTSAGIGLVTMRERAEGLGGTFQAGPHGPGWRVLAALPIQEH